MPQTLYIVTYPAGGGTPSNVQIVAGQNASGAAASWAGNAAWAGSGQYLEATGLSASTEYDSAAVIFDGTTYSNVVEVSGTWTTLSSGVTSNADVGTYTITGLTATGTRLLLSNASPGSYDLTGSASSGVRNLLSNADVGAYTITGIASAGSRSLLSNASPGSYSLTGSASTGVRNLLSNAAVGSIIVTCFDAVGTYTPIGVTTSNASPGIYTITGADTSETWQHVSAASPGAWTITGYPSTGSIPGVVTLTPEDLLAIADAVWAHSSATNIAIQLAEAWGRLGLDISKPLISGQTEISFGAIVMALTGNETASTLTRQ